MNDVLEDLNQTIAARGSLVVSADGMCVASHVREGVDEERLAALGASIIREIVLTIREAGYSGLRQVELATAQGKVILVGAGSVFLLVLLGGRLEIGPGSIEVRSAAKRIQKAAHLVASEQGA